MKLESCHIEGFGKIKNADLTFSPTLNSYCEANGYGKSTVAAFIKAMLYGLPSYRSNAADFGDRVHYYPFEGGAFGGSLALEDGGKKYKIERVFDAKSDTKDVLKVYCNKDEIKLENAGEALLQIDKTSFERTIFISGEDIKLESSSGINGKLRGFAAGGDDDLAAANKALDDKIKLYKKSKGDALISRCKNEISSLKASVKNLEQIKEGLEDKYARLDALKAEIDAITAKIASAQSLNVDIANWSHYDEMIEEIATTQNKIKALEKKYPFGVPTRDELNKASEAITTEKALQAKLSQKTFTDDDNARLYSLTAEFKDGIPSSEELDKLGKDIEKLADLTYEIKTIEGNTPSETEKALSQKFALHAPTNDELKRLEEKTAEFVKVKKQYDEIPQYISKTQEIAPAVAPVKKSKTPIIVVAVVAIALLLAGCFVTIFASKVAGIMLLAFGGVGLCIACATAFVKKANRSDKMNENSAALPSQVIQVENPEKTKSQFKLANLQLEVRSLPIRYGYDFEYGEEYAAKKLREDFEAYKELCKRQESRALLFASKKEERQALENGLKKAFASYGIVGENFATMLSRLRSDAEMIATLSRRKTAAEESSRGIAGMLEKNNRQIAAFCEKYRLSTNGLDEAIGTALSDGVDLKNFTSSLVSLQNKAEKFKTDKMLIERPSGQLEDMSALNVAKTEKQQLYTTLHSEIISDEIEAEKLDDLMNELEEKNRCLDEYNRQFDLLSRTREALNAADRNIKQRYIEPIKNVFVKYADQLEKALGEKPVFTSDLEIRFERGGIERDSGHLSSGQKAICALCFRLALIENMYGNNLPFVVLDDPFAYLDEEHLQNAKKLLLEMSARFQILYFCCHQSRKI